MGEREHRAGPGLQLGRVEMMREIVPGGAKDRPQRLALAHQQMQPTRRVIVFRGNDLQRDGLLDWVHGRQAWMASLSAARISGLSVIGSTMLDCTAASSDSPARTMRPAWISMRVDAPSSRPWPCRLRERCAMATRIPARSSSLPLSRTTVAASVGAGAYPDAQ